MEKEEKFSTILHKVYSDKCQYCGKICNNLGHIEHIVPSSYGGKDDLENITLACQSCNLRKSNHLLPEPYKGLLIGRAIFKKQKILKLISESKSKSTKYTPPKRTKENLELERKHEANMKEIRAAGGCIVYTNTGERIAANDEGFPAAREAFFHRLKGAITEFGNNERR